jgi:hypothetical protein
MQPDGSVALSLCTTVQPLYTKFTERFDINICETTTKFKPTAETNGEASMIGFRPKASLAAPITGPMMKPSKL